MSAVPVVDSEVLSGIARKAARCAAAFLLLLIPKALQKWTKNIKFRLRYDRHALACHRGLLSALLLQNDCVGGCSAPAACCWHPPKYYFTLQSHAFVVYTYFPIRASTPEPAPPVLLRRSLGPTLLLTLPRPLLLSGPVLSCLISALLRRTLPPSPPPPSATRRDVKSDGGSSKMC